MQEFLKVGFRAHDILSDFLQAHFRRISATLLAAAHLTILGAFFPSALKSLGEFALTLLMFILFLSPVSKILRMRLLYQLMGLRRELGIWVAYAALAHSAGYFLDPVFTTYISSAPPEAIPARLTFGFIGVILLTILLITSNGFSQRRLKSSWKKVHFLAYPAFAFALAHKAFSGMVPVAQDWSGITEFTLVFGGYLWLKHMARQGVPNCAKKGIEFVSAEYGKYKGTISTCS